jgi:hypothetical protein
MGMGFGVLAGLAGDAATGFRRALPWLAGLRAGAVLAVSFAFGVDLGALAGLAIRDVTRVLVAWTMPFALRAVADLVTRRAFVRAADFGVGAALARFAVARPFVAWVVALRAAADFAAGRPLREVAFAVPADLARRAIARFFFI